MEKVIILGAGPAGASAGIYLANSNIIPLIIYKDMGSLKKAKLIQNYYGLSKPLTGAELFNTGLNQLKSFGVNLINSEIVSIGYDGNFIVKTAENEYKSKVIILASGTDRKTIKLPGLKDYDGKGVSYCALCDAFFFKGKAAAVTGNGEYALHEADILSSHAKSVHILTNGEEPKFDIKKLNGKNIKLDKRPLLKVTGSQKLEKIFFDDNVSLDIDGLFIAMGSIGTSDIIKHLGIMADDRGHIKTDENKMTNLPGAFAAGDCTGGLLQVSKSVADGAVAAISAVNYLKNIQNKN